MNKKPLFTHFERVYKTKPTGRPKIDWSKLTKEQMGDQINKLRDNKITLIREVKNNIPQTRGCITLFGKKRFQHIGVNHRYGKIHMNTLIGRMTDEQLYDESRFKVQKNLLPKLRG